AARPAWCLLTAVVRPDGPDRVLVPESVGDGGARPVGEVPPPAVERRPHRPAARHLEVPVRVRLPDPVPGVPQPPRSVLLPLLRHPTNPVAPPPPNAASPGLPRLPADPIVVDLHQVGQVLARPPARGDPAHAPTVDRVGVPDLQLRLLRPVRDLLDPQRERVE